MGCKPRPPYHIKLPALLGAILEIVILPGSSLTRSKCDRPAITARQVARGADAGRLTHTALTLGGRTQPSRQQLQKLLGSVLRRTVLLDCAISESPESGE